MRTSRFIAVFAGTLLMARAAFADAIPVVPGDYTEIILATPDASANLQVRLDKPGILVPFAMMPPQELGALHFSAQDEKGKTVDIAGSTPLSPGTYVVTVTADHPSKQPFNITLRQLETGKQRAGGPSKDKANEVDLPLTDVLMLRSAADEAWYSFKIPGPGVVLVRLATLNGAPGDNYSLEQDVPQETDTASPDAANNTPSPFNVSASADGVARHYFEALHAGTWRVRAGRDARPSYGDEAASRLDIVYYPDSGKAEGPPSFVALGVSPDDPAIQQIRLRLRAEGKSVAVTNDPKVIANALSATVNEAAERAEAGRWGSLYWQMAAGMLVLLLLAAGGVYIYWRPDLSTIKTWLSSFRLRKTP